MGLAPQEIDTALESATELFWRLGYAETSVQDLVEATGLNRYALYNAFGDKRGLFIATLDAYHARGFDVFNDAFNDPDTSPLEATRKVYRWMIEGVAERQTGCLICNLALDVAHDDPVVSEKVDQYFAEIEAAKLETMRLAEQRGELNPALTPEDATRILMALMPGIGDHGRRGAGEAELNAVIDAAIAAIGRPPSEPKTS
ncbi:MAG: TetR/AcrR family transcriptional regulator [Pseudomonadota bacterium]